MEIRNCFSINKKLFLLRKFREKRKIYHPLHNNLFLRKNHIPGWVLDNYSQKRFLYFYGFFTLKKFKLFLNNVNFQLKNSLGLILEFILINFLFRLGLFTSTLKIYRIIQSGFVKVNGRVIKNPYFKLKVWDDISFIPRYRNKLQLDYILRIRQKKIIFNFPPFIEWNPRIFVFSI